MKKCIICKHEIRNSSIRSSMWNLSGWKNIVCEQCKSEYKVAFHSRLLIVIIIGGIGFICRSANIDFIYKAILFLTLSILVIIISPMIVQLKKID